MLLRRVLTTVGMAVVAVLASFAVATSAQAATTIFYTTDANPGGKMEWTPNGDIVVLCDQQADNKGVRGFVFDVHGALAYAFDVNGDGACKNRTASDGSDYDLVEGQEYEFEVCLTASGTGATQFCRVDYLYNIN